MEDKASDAYYKLSNPKSQIQSYVFDGKDNSLQYSHFWISQMTISRTHTKLEFVNAKDPLY